MEGMTRTIALCSIKTGQVTFPFLTAENVMNRDPSVKIQFATNMLVVSASVRVEYRTAMVNMRDLISTVLGPLSVAYVNSFVVPVSLEDMAKPLGESGAENRMILTG